MIYAFEDFIPVVSKSAFVHPLAAVIGNVIIGEDVYIGPGAVVRGDWGEIIVEDGSNIQENCTIHMFPGKQTILKKGAHIGHGAVIHGAFIGHNVLVGMNSVVMDDVIIGDNCTIGALSFVKARDTFPPRSLIVGNPAKVVKELSDEWIEWKTQGTALYQKLPLACQQSLKEVEPLRTIPKDRKIQPSNYKFYKH